MVKGIKPLLSKSIAKRGSSIPETRYQLQQALLFKNSQEHRPHLYAAAIAHFHSDGTIDAGRMRNYTSTLAQNVDGILLGGSTAEGWTMSLDQYNATIHPTLDALDEVDEEIRPSVIFGIMKRNRDDVHECIDMCLEVITQRYGEDTSDKGVCNAISKAGVSGFLIPPTGDCDDQVRVFGSADLFLIAVRARNFWPCARTGQDCERCRVCSGSPTPRCALPNPAGIQFAIFGGFNRESRWSVRQSVDDQRFER